MKIEPLKKHSHLISTIAKLQFDEFSYLRPDRTLAMFEEKVRLHLNENALPMTYVALDNRELLGTFSIRACDLDTHPQFTPWLASVIVPIPYRNRGIGAELVRTCEESILKMGYKELYLFTPNKSLWYKKLGWEIIEESMFNGTLIQIMKSQKIHSR